ncbi:MAG: DNA replication and repair protein RecF [Mariprofundaceae bacterium]|nr:DNA replication and repair protein RecF [Mariprofundaceae bacterium]
MSVPIDLPNSNHDAFQWATALTLDQVKVSDLRCHARLEWQLSAGMNLLVGGNGSGKTTLLEAICLMAHGRSFRQSRSPLLVKHGQERFMVHGQWHRFGPMHLSVAGRLGQTSIRLQGRDIQRRKDVSESFPVLVDAPQGRKIIDAVPGERRRWLDALIMICYPSMPSHYERYLRAVMQRGRLLRRNVFSNELDGWEQQIVHYGLPIVQARQSLLEELNIELKNELLLTEDVVHLSMKKTEYASDPWLLRLQEKRRDDAKVGSLRFGPQVDVVQIHFQDREIRSAGSRGQQKLAAIALKMAECALWAKHRRLIPVLLLDDCLEALDQHRQLRLFQRLQHSPAQIVMTAPDGLSLPEALDINIQSLSDDGLQRYTKQTSGLQSIVTDSLKNPLKKDGIKKDNMKESMEEVA